MTVMFHAMATPLLVHILLSLLAVDSAIVSMRLSLQVSVPTSTEDSCNATCKSICCLHVAKGPSAVPFGKGRTICASRPTMKPKKTNEDERVTLSLHERSGQAPACTGASSCQAQFPPNHEDVGGRVNKENTNDEEETTSTGGWRRNVSGYEAPREPSFEETECKHVPSRASRSVLEQLSFMAGVDFTQRKQPQTFKSLQLQANFAGTTLQ